MNFNYKQNKYGENLLLEKETKPHFLEQDEAPRRLSVDQLRKYKEYENVSEQDAANIIETLHQLAVLAYFYYVTFENEK